MSSLRSKMQSRRVSGAAHVWLRANAFQLAVFRLFRSVVIELKVSIIGGNESLNALTETRDEHRIATGNTFANVVRAPINGEP